MRALYQHVYTLHEMLEVFTRLCAREGSGRDGTERGELEMDLRGYPTWRRVRAPLSDLVAFECVPKKTARYADRRRAGARFPPIIAVPVDAANDILVGARMKRHQRALTKQSAQMTTRVSSADRRPTSHRWCAARGRRRTPSQAVAAGPRVRRRGAVVRYAAPPQIGGAKGGRIRRSACGASTGPGDLHRGERAAPRAARRSGAARRPGTPRAVSRCGRRGSAAQRACTQTARRRSGRRAPSGADGPDRNAKDGFGKWAQGTPNWTCGESSCPSWSS